MVAALLREDHEIEEVFECADSISARELIGCHRPDIVFLDIEMPEITGLDLARDLTEDGPVVVFVTAFSRYAPAAFEVSASDYVLKPFSDRRVNEALQQAKRRVRERRLGDLANKLATLSSELRPDDHPQEQRAPATTAASHSERATEPSSSRPPSSFGSRPRTTTSDPLEPRPPPRADAADDAGGRLDPRQFLRVHRGAIVNVQAVTEVRDAGGLTLVMTDGSEVP
jgi:two-component system LytT family response regulator